MDSLTVQNMTYIGVTAGCTMLFVDLVRYDIYPIIKDCFHKKLKDFQKKRTYPGYYSSLADKVSIKNKFLKNVLIPFHGTSYNIPQIEGLYGNWGSNVFTIDIDETKNPTIVGDAFIELFNNNIIARESFFDTIVLNVCNCFGLRQILIDPLAILKQLVYLLKSHGLLYITGFHLFKSKLKLQDLNNLNLRTLGLDVSECLGLNGYYVFIKDKDLVDMTDKNDFFMNKILCNQ